ncbi:MAG: CHAD domain-containing protein [Acidobacteriota bacterium]
MTLAKLNTTTYAAPEDMDGGRLQAALAAHFRTSSEARRPYRVSYFDTFDWRCYRAGFRLRFAPGARGAVLSWLAGEDERRFQWATRSVPPFAGAFSDGPLRRALSPVLQMRRLLPVVELKVNRWRLRILDRRDKTVVWLELEHAVARAPGGSQDPVALPPLLELRPVRGYAKAHRRVMRFLETELELSEMPDRELDRALAAIGRQAGDYTSKVVIDLDPAMPAADATKRIHRELLAAMRRNEPGTRKDLDSEFLHDFRVAVRRSRSALTQIKKVYPEEAIARFKPELAWLGSITGPTRDLDVYLLKMEDYQKGLSAERQSQLEPLVEHLRGAQRRAQKRMVRAMSSKRYRELIDGWERFLHEPSALESPQNAARPIAEVASERIWKVYRRVIKNGSAIDDDTPADPIHELRIECKKLRYLMEFFRGFYDREAIGRVIKSLKRLQDNLGTFNDCEVQRGGLIGFAEEMQREGEAPVTTLMAIGRLADDLEAGQAHERRIFGERFAAFSQPHNQRLARQLFASG